MYGKTHIKLKNFLSVCEKPRRNTEPRPKKDAASSTQFCSRAINIYVQGFQQRGVKFLGVVDLKVRREFEGLRNNGCI